MQLNRSPAVYDDIVKNISKDEEKSLTVLEWKMLNTESTLCLFLCSSLLFATCLYVFEVILG